MYHLGSGFKYKKWSEYCAFMVEMGRQSYSVLFSSKLILLVIVHGLALLEIYLVGPAHIPRGLRDKILLNPINLTFFEI